MVAESRSSASISDDLILDHLLDTGDRLMRSRAREYRDGNSRHMPTYSAVSGDHSARKVY